MLVGVHSLLSHVGLKQFSAQVILGGGQEAMNVTTTSARQGKFEARFWHKVFEEEVGRVKGHFGPLNTYVQPHISRKRVLTLCFFLCAYSIAVHPRGEMFASGGEDGFIRVHHFDESYFRAKPYGDIEIAE